jgi:hypothetical protein
MLRKRHTVGLAIVSALLFTGGMLTACGGGGGSDPDEDSNDLVVVEFSLIDQAGHPTGATGTTNAYRNNLLKFTFSENVDESTVSDRTVQIGIPSGTNLFLTATGRFEVDGNVVIFDPRVTVIGGPHPFGFEADSTYSVTVKGLPETKTIQSTSGDPVLSSFATSFTTTDLYLPDHDQPEITAITPPALDANSVAHLMGQTPEERNDENDATGIWEPVWVDSRADVILEFSEAMNPATFDAEVSFLVTNVDRGREVLGVFKYSDDARTVTFRPTFGFGRGPYLVRVDVSVDLTDLAGNPISNPQTWYFLTEYDPSAVNEGVMEEYFDDNVYEDTAFSPPGAEGIATWNPVVNPGKLASTFGNRSITMPTAPAGSSNWIPLGASAWVSCRFQCWYKPNELGTAGTISALSFFPGSTFTQGSVLSNFTVQAGHTNAGLSPGAFASNFKVGTPVTLLNGVSYTMPSNMVYNSPAAFPALEKSFGFNGTNNVVFDLGKSGVTGNGSTWSCRSGFDSNIRRIWNTSQTSTSSNGSDTGYTYPWVVSFRTETSMARSLWYKMDSPDPVFLDPIINPTEQPAGTETTVMFEGAIDDGNGQVDPTSASGLTDDVVDLDGYEYIRFRVTFTANLGTGVGPALEDIVIPYIFF